MIVVGYIVHLLYQAFDWVITISNFMQDKLEELESYNRYLDIKYADLKNRLGIEE